MLMMWIIESQAFHTHPCLIFHVPGLREMRNENSASQIQAIKLTAWRDERTGRSIPANKRKVWSLSPVFVLWIGLESFSHLFKHLKQPGHVWLSFAWTECLLFYLLLLLLLVYYHSLCALSKYGSGAHTFCSYQQQWLREECKPSRKARPRMPHGAKYQPYDLSSLVWALEVHLLMKWKSAT